MVAYLQKSKGSKGFHQIINFLNASHIQYALTENPMIYVSFIKQFWSTSTAKTSDNGEVELPATIDGQEKTITEASLRRHLKLEDNGGITALPNTDIFKQLALMGPASMPYDSPLQSIHSLECDKGSMQQNELTNLVTKLTDRVAVLENDLKQTKRRARLVVLEDEDAPEDSSKHGRKIFEIDEDPTLSLMKNLLSLWKIVAVVKKGENEVITVNVPISTASATPEVSIVAANLVYIRRSAKKRKDKGKAIMREYESVKKKSKKQLEQERLGHEEAIRLQEQIDDEERQKVTRDAEIARQLQEEINIAGQEKVVAEVDQAHDIDWSDPSMIRYHALQNRPRSVSEVRKNMYIYLKNQGGYKMKYFKGMSYDDIKPIFEKVWDQILSFVPMDSELELQRLKKQLEDDPEKEKLQVYLNIVLEDEGLDVESLATKQDVLELYRLVKERFQTASPKGYDLLLWGDLKTMIEPSEEDDIWKNQQDWNLISWKLHNFCGVHVILMSTGLVIHMLVEKKYPLSQDILSKMLNRRLEVDHQSEMGYELIMFVKSQIQ
ncbi:hypothetical protein Tco_1011666 [Tanacetum coccineum]